MKRMSVLLAACWLVLGCDDNKESTKDDDNKAAHDDGKPDPDAKADDGASPPEALPPLADLEPEPGPDPSLRVKLPPSPSFDETTVPAKYPDGALSIAGLRADLAKNMADGDKGIQVEVRATVQEIHVPPECPEGETCPPAKQPYLWVVDRAGEKGKRHAMIVANFQWPIPEWDARRWADQPEPVMEVGKTYTMKGKFRFATDTGFAHDRGVFEFVALKDGTEWIYPPGSPFHPLEVARQEATPQQAVPQNPEH